MLPSRMRFIATTIFLVTYFLTTIQSEDVALPEEPPPANPPDPKILSSCTSKLSNSRYTLTCSGYLSVPTNDPIFKEINPAQVGTLVLAKNHLQTVKPSEFTFASFDNLIEIDLSRNQINDIKRGAFGGLSLLWKIDLSFNKINTLDMEAFESINKLQYLNLQGNPIHKFEGSSFPLLPSLKSLDLRDCSINVIPTNAFRNLKDLAQLYLGGNRIERLDWNLFTSNTVLHHLQLKNNPWNCDCHVKFLMNFFKNIMVLNAINSDDITCSQPQSLNGTLWNAVPLDSLICPPLVKPLKTILSHPAHDDQIGNDKVYMSYGKDVAFECIIEADPAPEVFWLKDGTDLKFASGEGALGSSRDLKSSPAHFEMLDVDMKLRENYKQFNYEYRKLLRIYNTQLEDIGLYSCQARSPVGEHASKIFLNFSSIPDGTTTISPVNAGGGTLLIWLLVLLGILILLCFIMCIFYLWRRRDDKRQKELREQMLEKFKGSHNVVDDTGRSGEDSNPLLTPAGARSQIRSSNPSLIPDVAQGSHNTKNERSLSPEVSSPRQFVPPSDVRKQFFTRQMSEPPVPLSPTRGGGSVPFYNYNNMANRRMMPQFQSQTLHNRPSPQRQHFLPPQQQQIRRPGSAMSLFSPPPSESIYGTRVPLTRQLSTTSSVSAYPPYATMRYTNRGDRAPSVSSYASEPPMHLDGNPYGYNNPGSYVTLPRSHGHSVIMNPPRADSGFGRSLSPTESMYSGISSYSTLPRNHRIQRNQPLGVIYDSVGPRTTADGGSTLSLNKIGESPGPFVHNRSNPLDDINQGLMSPINGKVKSTRNRVGSSTTPGSLRGRGEFFSFEPIQEVEDSGSKLSSSAEIDKVLLPKVMNTPTNSESRYKKKPSPVVTIPPKSRKPIRTFEYPKHGTNLDGPDNNENSKLKDGNGELPPLPTSPVPKKPPRSLTSLENIYEEPLPSPAAIVGNVEGTEV